MQEPQVIGIAIGLFLIGLGWFIRRFLVLQQKRTAGGVTLAILSYIGVLLVLQNTMFSYGSSWSWKGVLMAWTGLLGAALATSTIAFLGFVYKPNKVAGYVVALIVFTNLTMIGRALSHS